MGQILWCVNRDMGILKRLIKAQAKLIDYLLKIVYSPYSQINSDDEADITNLLADIKKIADKTKKKK